MKNFLDHHFLLHNETAEMLYYQYAAALPLIDYHNHLSPKDIALNRRFDNLSQAWLEGDHYKWRAMRTNGIQEKYCTGNANDWEKFEKWASTVPNTLRNPLYHWTHLELQRYFDIQDLLNTQSARKIYEEASTKLRQPDFAVRSLLEKMKVELICTTDDPIDSLEFHQKIQLDHLNFQVFPTFRPDKPILWVNNQAAFNQYLDQLADVSGVEIRNFQDLKYALEARVDFFHRLGCRLADHGLESIPPAATTDTKTEAIFDKARLGKSLNPEETHQYQYDLLFFLGTLYHSKGWTQQFHLGALRNNNTRMMRSIGPDTGFDSIGDFKQAKSLVRFLDDLDKNNQLPRTILYNLNPADNEIFATLIGNFNDGSIPGKVQFGSGWWFNDQKDGMERQINALSNMGLLSCFVGMLTDSRSFLSFPRHEYFRRILCNLLGQDVERGELPLDRELLGQLVQNICYYNAKNYFEFIHKK
ncbi:MAG: glucuronate isomerase [Microscillaceae bacterium]|nr:glucuronate isomerase [Microscillaceae bacterium]